MTLQKLLIELINVFTRLQKNHQDTRAISQLESATTQIGKYANKRNDQQITQAYKHLAVACQHYQDAAQNTCPNKKASEHVVTAIDLLKQVKQ